MPNLSSHFSSSPGHIELPLPVHHPIFFRQMFQLLKGTCHYCHHL